jgi:hypothetical protein
MIKQYSNKTEKRKMVKMVKQCSRIGIDFVIAVALLLVFITGMHSHLPAAVQLITLKMILVSMAVVHAHIVGKILLGKVDWTEQCFSPQKVLRVAFYVSFIIAYSLGG